MSCWKEVSFFACCSHVCRNFSCEAFWSIVALFAVYLVMFYKDFVCDKIYFLFFLLQEQRKPSTVSQEQRKSLIQQCSARRL